MPICSFWKSSQNTCVLALLWKFPLKETHVDRAHLYAERIRNSADCEQVQDKKPLSHDKLNIELWGLAKLRNIHSVLSPENGEIQKGRVRLLLYEGMESLKVVLQGWSSLTFTSISMAENVRPSTLFKKSERSKWGTKDVLISEEWQQCLGRLGIDSLQDLRISSTVSCTS